MNKLKIAIICSMKEEISYLEEYIKKSSILRLGKIRLHFGKIKNVSFFLLISGIGKVFSSMATTWLINKISPDIIMNFGIMGGLKELKIGDMVISKKTCYYDFDLSCFGYEIGQVPELPKFFYSDTNLIRAAKDSVKSLNFNCVIGTTCSGDRFIFGKRKSDFFHNFFPEAVGVDMEGAAIAQVCHLFSIPFVSIRSISDIINQSNTKEEVYENKKALLKPINDLNSVVINFLKQISKIHLS
ncbi:5'-methylthioadenosine/adenosylhomocysteine nucleosidase [Candidatus Riesia pediculicola]|uniref:adenosylhomocysteine nucleosidase n=1 Tax=Riesia pediculicola (strain USDA) TaxID=515618 RepID=D4G817_RIEPU|nr:5'-methylthioadenosine/adenosylhomocysteine nucleosidase [Candidatus Riesia pediculicola]ADD79790.1 MTA/SAH nucleosidase [Candidatus Riesia pediculicola USDA]QOJ86367.1 5'-methylthioadenosine/adenosylhomocysteine nucleosidase [Candidatus Riesia pediculicola]